MQGLTLFNLNLTHLLDAFLETAVPMIVLRFSQHGETLPC